MGLQFLRPQLPTATPRGEREGAGLIAFYYSPVKIIANRPTDIFAVTTVLLVHSEVHNGRLRNTDEHNVKVMKQKKTDKKKQARKNNKKKRNKQTNKKAKEI